MRPIQHPSNNDVLRAPPGASVEQCRPLPITRVMFDSGIPAVWSYWQPSDAERKAIATGASIRFSVYGLQHPPMHIGVDGVEEAG